MGSSQERGSGMIIDHIVAYFKEYGEQVSEQELIDIVAEKYDYKKSQIRSVLLEMETKKEIYRVNDFPGWIGMLPSTQAKFYQKRQSN